MTYYQRKLNHFQVYEIVGRLLKGEMFADIAKDYGVHRETIFSIYEKKTWTYMTKKINFDKHDERRRRQAESLKSKSSVEENLPSSKLNKTQLFEIIDRLSKGELAISIAKDYNYTQKQIRRIAKKTVFTQYTKDISFDKFWENDREYHLLLNMPLVQQLQLIKEYMPEDFNTLPENIKKLVNN